MVTSDIEQLKEEVSRLEQRLLEADRAISIPACEARHFDKLKTIEALSRSVVHQLGTALNIVTGYAHLIQDSPGQSDDVKEMAATIKQQADAITLLVRRLIHFGSVGSAGAKNGNLCRIAKDTVDLFSDFAKRKGIELTFFSRSPDARVVGEPHLLEQAIAGLLRSVLEDSPKGSVFVHVNERDHAPALEGLKLEDYHLLSITGQAHSEPGPIGNKELFSVIQASPALPLEVQEFAVCNDIVQDCGGWIKIVETSAKGQSILMYLPKQVPE